MSEWGRFQDLLHDEFDRQGVTGVDVNAVIEAIVNVRDFFPGLLCDKPALATPSPGAGREGWSARRKPDDPFPVPTVPELDDILRKSLPSGVVYAIHPTGDPFTGWARMMLGAGSTRGEPDQELRTVVKAATRSMDEWLASSIAGSPDDRTAIRSWMTGLRAALADQP